MRVVEAHAKVRDLLRAEGLEERIGYFGRHISVDQAIAEFQKAQSVTQDTNTDQRGEPGGVSPQVRAST